MEHTPDKCPNRQLIMEISKEVVKLKGDLHQIDKDTAVYATRQDEQYKTIIEMLTLDRATREKTAERVGIIEKALAVNEYQTNKTTNLIDQITLGAIVKIVGLMTSVGIIATIFMEVWRQ